MKLILEVKDVELTLTMDEAEKLWNDLNKLFKAEPQTINREVIHHRTYPIYDRLYGTCNSQNLASNAISAKLSVGA